MVQMTVELTLEQLIEAVKKLPLQDQLTLVQSLFKEGLEDKTPDQPEGLSKNQVQCEVERLVHYLRGKSRPPGNPSADSWGLDEEDDSELTVFTDHQADEFQA